MTREPKIEDLIRKWYEQADRSEVYGGQARRECADELSALLREEAPPVDVTACGLTVPQLHKAVYKLDKHAACERGEHEWGAMPGGVQCRWCRARLSGAEAEAVWRHEAVPEAAPQERRVCATCGQEMLFTSGEE